MCPPRTSRSGPELSAALVRIADVRCGRRAAAGAPRTQPRSGKNPRVPRGFCRCPGPPAEDHGIVANAWLVVPEGRRRKLAGGKPAQRAWPPVLPPDGPCPSGASKKNSAASSPQHFRQHASPRAFFFDAPLGHGVRWHGFRGRRPLGRTCPRLISSGVPPGREPGVPPAVRKECGGRQNIPLLPSNFTRCDRGPIALHFGCGSAALYYDSSESSRAARIFSGARLGVRRTSRSRLSAADAADFNDCLRRCGAAAAGPRRTQPRSVRVAASPPGVHHLSVLLHRWFHRIVTQPPLERHLPRVQLLPLKPALSQPT